MATSGIEIIMEDDTREGSAPMEPADLQKLGELAAYRIDRQEAELWAHRDIKFLVYGDTNLQQNGYDSDDEEGMVEYAMLISGGSGLASEDESESPKCKESEDWNEEVVRAGPSSLGNPHVPKDIYNELDGESRTLKRRDNEEWDEEVIHTGPQKVPITGKVPTRSPNAASVPQFQNSRGTSGLVSSALSSPIRWSPTQMSSSLGALMFAAITLQYRIAGLYHSKTRMAKQL
jgi:hypothetical protein